MSEIKVNVMLIAVLGAVVVLGLAALMPQHAGEVWTLAGGLVGAFGATMKSLTEDSRLVPGSIVENIVAAMKDK